MENGAYIITDTKMAQAGINKKRIEERGGKVLCFIGDDDVAKEAAQRDVTRSYVSMGVVPVGEEMRKWRDANGSAMVWSASAADSVIRVFCGIGLKMK